MTTLSLTGLYVYRDVVRLGYPVLESFLSTVDMVDQCVICIDPTSDSESINLVNALASKFPQKVRIVEFTWPIGATGDGSVIGIASNFALAQCRTSHFVNVQADELWSPILMQETRDHWREAVGKGIDCLRFHVLSLEHNMQNEQHGAGYTHSVKLARVCPAIRFEPDAWSLSGCTMLANVAISESSPIVHCHDHFRDHLIDIRFNAANALWTDREKFGHYLQSAETIKSTKDEWFNDPLWTNRESRYSYLLPDFAKWIIGRTSYSIRWELLNGWNKT